LVKSAGPGITGIAGQQAEAGGDGVRDEVQRLSLANKHQGYRPVTVLLKRAGWIVNHKRVAGIRREDNCCA